jgi:predicted ABC-type ATPase
MKEEKPVLVVFAGPNGSGKSSIVKEAFNQGAMPSLYINADDITREKLGNLDIHTIDKVHLDKVNLEAANEADRQRQEAIKAGKSFSTETVMSTPTKIDLMREAKANGYDVHLIYVTTQDPNINIGRVQDRIEKGGHAVPPEKIAVRYERAMQLLPEAIQVADTAKVYDNSLEYPIRIIEKTIANEIKMYPRSPMDIRSKWTQESLEEIKQNVVKIDERFKAIEAAPDIKKLGNNPPMEKLYTAYAKATLAQNGNAWNQKTDHDIMVNMVKGGISQRRIRAAMNYSPSMFGLSEVEKAIKIGAKLNNLAKEPEIKKLIKSRGLER